MAGKMHVRPIGLPKTLNKPRGTRLVIWRWRPPHDHKKMRTHHETGKHGRRIFSMFTQSPQPQKAHAQTFPVKTLQTNPLACVFICIYTLAYIYIYMYIYTCIYTCMYTKKIYTYTYIYLFILYKKYSLEIHIYMYVHMYDPVVVLCLAVRLPRAGAPQRRLWREPDAAMTGLQIPSAMQRIEGPQRHKEKDPLFCLQGSRQGGFQKSSFVGSSRLSGRWDPESFPESPSIS